MFKSILSRLFWTYAAILALVFASVAVSVGIFTDRFVTNQHRQNVRDVSQTIEYWTAVSEIEDDGARTKVMYMNLLKKWADYLHSDIIITNAEGRIIANTGSVTVVPDDLVSAVISGEEVREVSTLNGAYRSKVVAMGIPVHYQGVVVGAMIFTTPVERLRKTTTELFSMLVLSSLLAVLIAGVLVYWQSRRISKPIGEINKAARNIASGKYDKRVVVTSKDEIGQLASSFNFMAD